MNLKSLIVGSLVAFSSAPAFAGFQFGVICEDANGAQYVYSEAILYTPDGEDGLKNPTECLKGSCDSRAMAISGVTEDDGFLFAAVLDGSISFTDAAFAAKYIVDGEDLESRRANGVELICSDRRLLSEITGEN